MFGKKNGSLREVWDNNISVTMSGMFSLNPLVCRLRNTKVEKILYSVDYPLSSNEECKNFLTELEESGMVITRRAGMHCLQQCRATTEVESNAIVIDLPSRCQCSLL